MKEVAYKKDRETAKWLLAIRAGLAAALIQPGELLLADHRFLIYSDVYTLLDTSLDGLEVSG